MLKSAAVTTALLLTFAGSPSPAPLEPGVSTVTVIGAGKKASPNTFWCAFFRMC